MLKRTLIILSLATAIGFFVVAPWQKAEPGQHLSPEEVKSVVANSPGWAQDTLIKAEEVKLPTKQWAMRTLMPA